MFIHLVLGLLMTNIRALPNITINNRLNDEWKMFKTNFGKQYESHVEISRRLIWEDNLRFIQQHNLESDLGKHSYYLGINQFADMTNKEFSAQYMGKTDQKYNDSIISAFLAPENMEQLPTTVDWRTKGYVTPVKNQKTCGSCWAFSVVGSLEGQHYRKTGKLISFSEQQLVDCDYRNRACKGGSLENAFDYMMKNGMESDKSYHYIASKGTCKYDPLKVEGTCKGYVKIPPGDEVALATAVATVGPISVAIDGTRFQFYKYGIHDYHDCSSTNLDHAVLIVGYGFENGLNYWIVKNSWGKGWGIEGYIKMSKDSYNQCGIASDAMYPIV